MNSSSEIWTIQRLLLWSTDYLGKNGVESPQLDAQILLADVLNIDRIQLLLQFEKPLNKLELAQFKSHIKKRAQHEPVAYIVGKKAFFKHTFNVGPGVLIPRPESEHIVEYVLGKVEDKNDPIRILDIGLGSGCLAISLAAALPQSQVFGWELSPEALEVARANAKQILGLGRCHFENVDARDPSVWNRDDKFDFIVSNPPYISHSESPQLPISVVKYEPHLALFGENDGLEFYEIYAAQAKKLLKPGGQLVLELGQGRHSEISALFNALGWDKLEIVKDYSAIARVLVATNT